MNSDFDRAELTPVPEPDKDKLIAYYRFLARLGDDLAWAVLEDGDLRTAAKAYQAHRNTIGRVLHGPES